jgi:hypothetical protein
MLSQKVFLSRQPQGGAVMQDWFTRADALEIDTRDYVLQRAHQTLRDVMWEGRYDICEHAVQHARAQGFLEPDIVQVLHTGRIRAVYPQDRRWLVMGYFQSVNLKLPLHVVVDFHHKDHWIDVVTAYVPKNPHQILSRSRVAVMLRFDSGEVKTKQVRPGAQKGKWKRSS